jgi:hypothetical protein
MNNDLLPDLLLAVEQQLASRETRYVAETLRRLLELGIDEAEAKIQIALCLGQEMDDVLRSRRPFDEPSYRAALADLPFPADDGEAEDGEAGGEEE